MALGCNDVSDIRLHYFAAKEFTRNRKTGGYFRVDNSVGDKVEIIISDIQSYLYAMRYMLAFNDKNDLFGIGMNLPSLWIIIITNFTVY